jgi:hypothetical protein
MAVEQAFQIPLEPFLIFGLMAVGAILDRRDAEYAAQWQLVLDRTHHGTPLKPYDWELEV